MTKYRLKNATVDALQWFPGVKHDLVRYEDGDKNSPYIVNQIYEKRVVHSGDWIVFYPNQERPDIFEDVKFRDMFEAIPVPEEIVEDYWSQEDHSCLEPEKSKHDKLVWVDTSSPPLKLIGYYNKKETGSCVHAISLNSELEKYFRQLLDIPYSKPISTWYRVENSSAAYALALVAGRADFLCSGIGVCAPGPGPQSRVAGADHGTRSLAGADLSFCVPG